MVVICLLSVVRPALQGSSGMKSKPVEMEENVDGCSSNPLKPPAMLKASLPSPLKASLPAPLSGASSQGPGPSSAPTALHAPPGASQLPEHAGAGE